MKSNEAVEVSSGLNLILFGLIFITQPRNCLEIELWRALICTKIENIFKLCNVICISLTIIFKNCFIIGIIKSFTLLNSQSLNHILISCNIMLSKFDIILEIIQLKFKSVHHSSALDEKFTWLFKTNTYIEIRHTQIKHCDVILKFHKLHKVQFLFS